MSEVVKLPLEEITLDPRAQPRRCMNPKTVKEYALDMKGGKEFPPIVVFKDDSDGVPIHFLADGWHRCEAAKKVGDDIIMAHVHQPHEGETAIRSAILYAAGANAEHGLRRTNSDKRHAVSTLLADEEWFGWSDREIARRARVDHKLVAKLRAEHLGKSPDRGMPDRVKVKRGGKVHKQRRKKSANSLAQADSADAHTHVSGLLPEALPAACIRGGSCTSQQSVSTGFRLICLTLNTMPGDAVEAFQQTHAAGAKMSADEAYRWSNWFSDYAEVARQYDLDARQPGASISASPTQPADPYADLEIPESLKRSRLKN